MLPHSATGAILCLIIAFAVLIAWLLSIHLLIDAAKAKGYEMEKTGLLWFVGIFATPIVVGLYVNALPDIREKGVEY